MLKLEKGRPADCAGRLEKEVRTYDFLDKLNIEYERIDHEAAMTMEECADVDEALGAMICKNLFLCNRQKTEFYLLMMPGHKSLRTKELSAQIPTSRLSFASGEDMVKYLNVLPGSATVMGLMNDTENHVQLLVDEEILKDEYVGCHPCVNTSSVKICTEDVFGKFLDAVHHDYITVTLSDNSPQS